MSSATGIPRRADLLEDTGTGAAQHTLSAKERAANTGHFQIPQTADLTGYRILLCDDVLTTGSTMNRCAELLKSRGAAVVTAAAAFQKHSAFLTLHAKRKKVLIFLLFDFHIFSLDDTTNIDKVKKFRYNDNIME